MASVIIRYTCGCGYSTRELEAAIKHSDEKLHTLTVLGEVRAPKKLKTPAPPDSSLVMSRTSVETDFGSLRAKLARR